MDTQDSGGIVAIVKAIAPGFAGINLEDISAPRCFEIEARLRDALGIPVFHDDQHGTAIVMLAALTNALYVSADTQTGLTSEIAKHDPPEAARRLSRFVHDLDEGRPPPSARKSIATLG